MFHVFPRDLHKVGNFTDAKSKNISILIIEEKILVAQGKGTFNPIAILNFKHFELLKKSLN